MRKLWLIAILSFYFAILIGCSGSAGSSGNESSPPPPVPKVTLSAQPTVILAGQSATLTWASSNASSATLNGASVAASGTMTVSPTQTTAYTINVSGAGGTASAQTTVTVIHGKPTVSMSASPGTIIAAQVSTLTVTASNAASVTVTDNLDSTQYALGGNGGTQTVTPTKTITYTATANGADNQTVTAKVTVKVNPGNLHASVNHIIFMMQENRTFDHYFGMLNPYRQALGLNIGDDGNTYDVDGIDDKLTTISNQDDEGALFTLFKLKSTCIDDDSSSWLPSWGDINRYDFSPTRSINMDGFVHTAEGYAQSCVASGTCGGGQFTDVVGQRAMGYYDQTYLNYYYYMVSQFALSDRWFSPMATESIPNRIATLTGGTTQGLVWDPGRNDGLPQLAIQNIFQELDNPPGVSWKIYYSTTNDNCNAGDNSCGSGVPLGKMPSTTFTYFKYSTNYVSANLSQGQCTPPKQPSGIAVGDPKNDFCIDVSHIAPISQFISDMKNGTLPAFAWVEPGYSHTDEHPGSGQSILLGQASIANLFNTFMASPSWRDSIFFWSYDEGGGLYDHVPPVPGHTNDFTDTNLGITTDISRIAVNPDSYGPCAPPNLPNPPGPATLHCDLHTVPFNDPGVNPTDAAAIDGFKAQLGFRLPNIVLSPFTRRHYVSHIPIDHTAIIKLVETRFLNGQTLTLRDAAQPDLMDFFDFTNVPWLTPPSNVPAPYNPALAGTTCTANNM